MSRTLLLALALFVLTPRLWSQDLSNDSARIIPPAEKKLRDLTVNDTLGKPKHSPKKAAIRSAILPGWGQVYNKKYWKVPLVYTAIGIPIGTFVYNRKWYARTRDAAKMLANNDTANYRQRVDEKLYVYFSTPGALPTLLRYRNDFRKNMDYSILFTLLFWGLNVVDATVDAHLKDFDVSDNLSMRIKPTILSGSYTAGLTVVFTIGPNGSKTISSR